MNKSISSCRFLHHRSYNPLNNSRMNSPTVGSDLNPGYQPTNGSYRKLVGIRLLDLIGFQHYGSVSGSTARIHSPRISIQKSQWDCHLFKLVFSCTAIQSDRDWCIHVVVLKVNSVIV